MPDEGRIVTLSRKKIREITGFTFSKIGSDPGNWISRARDFKDAAELIAKSGEYSPPIPYYYNSGLALELVLKAIAIAKSIEFKTTHRLNDLCKLIGLKITKDQECTLELLSELIVWSGRYPVPKKEGQWDNYHDVVQEKHIVREKEGNVGRTLANRDRFPTLQNVSTIWDICEAEYKSAIASKA
jgi:HEPN domain-containing protein